VTAALSFPTVMEDPGCLRSTSTLAERDRPDERADRFLAVCVGCGTTLAEGTTTDSPCGLRVEMRTGGVLS